MSTSSNPYGSEDVIRASEIGEYVHCNRAWWLGHVQGVENQNRALMDAGTARHQEHGRRVWRATMMQYGARFLAALALAALIFLALRIFNLV